MGYPGYWQSAIGLRLLAAHRSELRASFSNLLKKLSAFQCGRAGSSATRSIRPCITRLKSADEAVDGLVQIVGGFVVALVHPSPAQFLLRRAELVSEFKGQGRMPSRMKLYWSLRTKRFCSGSRSVCTSTPHALGRRADLLAERRFGEPLHLDDCQLVIIGIHISRLISATICLAGTVGWLAK